MDVVIKRRDMILVAPNQRYTVPDEIGRQLVDRGSAEDITAVVGEMEEAKAGKRGKK